MSKKLNVLWSDRLEKLAEMMFGAWDADASGDPFSRTCVVVGDFATRNWLQSYFLLHRKPGARRILANIDFVPLAEFINDWLAAQTGEQPELRRPADHPYANGVLAWRIDAILRDCAGDKDLKELAAYVGDDPKTAASRRFGLATRLAQLFDDYLSSRYRKLVNWERGIIPSGESADDRWQRILYRKLIAQSAETYTKDFDEALAPEADLSRAFGNGFPRYRAIHVFDVAVAPESYLAMLARLSAQVPVLFWNFCPAKPDWLDDPTKRQAARELVRSTRERLARGETPDALSIDEAFDSPAAKLLGALAPASRGVLGFEFDLDENASPWFDDESRGDFGTLRSMRHEVHSCHSPRRELEALRDSLHGFFAESPDARPSDALVLCADWSGYAPLIEAVFGSGADSVIPYALDCGIMEETPLSRSLGDIFAFRENRFGVNDVFALLGVPAIREKYGIDADGVSTLRDMVRGNNLHWGIDDADVDETLGCASGSHPFTWRRGMDRLLLDSLIGPRDDREALIDAGELGRLLPVGNVEGERARLAGRLEGFVRELVDFRAFARESHDADEWRARLLKVVDDFYVQTDDSTEELASIRRAVLAVTENAIKASTLAPGAASAIPGDVMCQAVVAAVKATVRRVWTPGDAVRFAPLKAGSAVPARFVWICGLNDGKFPRSEYRPSFDEIGRRPTIFDVSPRESDSFALLKAAMGARQMLCFSYVGRDIHTNDKLAPAVPLSDLLDMFEESGVKIAKYDHTLQAYSPQYFVKESGLPRSYSAENHDAALALLRRGRNEPEHGPTFSAFELSPDGETLLALDDVVSFLARPNTFLAKRRLQLLMDGKGTGEIDDDEPLAVRFGYARKCAIKCSEEADEMLPIRPDAMVEVGDAPDEDSVASEIDAMLCSDEVRKIRSRTLKFEHSPSGYDCAAIRVLDVFRKAKVAEPSQLNLPAVLDGRTIRTTGVFNLADAGGWDHAVAYSECKGKSGKVLADEIAMVARHVAGHAAGMRFVSVMLYGDGTLRAIYPLEREVAAGKWRDMLGILFGPLPDEMPDLGIAWVDDALPDDLMCKVTERITFDNSAKLHSKGRMK